MNNKITRLSFIVLAQVFLFVFVYLLTIALGAALIWAVFHASIVGIPYFIDHGALQILSFRRIGLFVLIGIVIFIVGLWFFVLALGIYLIKPLFLLPKHKHNYGREIVETDAPALFALIKETTKEVGVKMPKHVFVNAEVNACVFFNTSFWNIFFPVRKNLAIGLGLFEGMSVNELKSVLGHEFGHFSQKSMRVGSVLYITNKVITDLVYRRDALDHILIKWSLKDGIWGFWGVMTQSSVKKFRNIIEKLFRIQQRSYMKLSRQMEYDADNISCRIVGKESFVSAMCKIQKLVKNFELYTHAINNLLCEDIYYSDYWDGYRIATACLKEHGACRFSYTDILDTPESEPIKSRIVTEEIWNTHPSTEKRIVNVLKINEQIDASDNNAEAWSLIPNNLKEEISFEIFAPIKEDPNKDELERIHFIRMLINKVENSFFPTELEDFFNRDFIITSESERESIKLDNNPLTEQNRSKICEYQQALKDKKLLDIFYEKKLPIEHFVYNGDEYNIDDVPLDVHKEYLESLRNQVVSIDYSIRAMAENNVTDPSLVSAIYEAIAYGQSINNRIYEDFQPVRQDIVKKLNEIDIAGEEDFHNLCDWLKSYETSLQDVAKTLKYSQVAPFMAREEFEHLVHFKDADCSFYNNISGDAVNNMFLTTDLIVRVHEHLCHNAKMVLAAILLKQELPNFDFLKEWIGPESAEADNEQENADALAQ